MDQVFISMREEKQRRLKAIEDLIQRYSIRTQGELVEKLRENGFKANQSAISRDISDLELVKDPVTNCYTLSKNAKRSKERVRLQELLSQAGDVSYDTNPKEVLMIRTDPSYAHLIASQLEDYLSSFGYVVGTVAGMTGTILLVVAREEKEQIQAELSHLFEGDAE